MKVAGVAGGEATSRVRRRNVEGVTDALDRYLSEALAAVAPDEGGSLPESPHQLAEADPARFGVAIGSADGQVFSAGDHDVEFAIQSISKALVYAMALHERGPEVVEATVGVEPSGEPYNAPSVDESGRPDNPMINAGAMAVHGLLLGPRADCDDRIEVVLDTFSALAGRRLAIDEQMCEDELAGANANLSIAYMLRARGVLPDDPQDVVRGYLAQCSVKVTADDLAMMGATLAAGGRQPVTGEQVFPRDIVKHTLSVMMTCGMYDATGDWVSRVGIPAKSGVGGGILGVVSGRGGIGTFSPRLDDHGNSVRGISLFERFSDDLGFHFVDALDELDHRWEELLSGKGDAAAGRR